MLNLSEMARESNIYTPFKHLRSLRDPDIYLAENIKDFQDNAPNLDFPWYKRNVICPGCEHRAYIVFNNIGVKTPIYDGIEFKEWAILHDSSGKDVFYWNKEHEFFSSLVSREELEKEQGLKKDDWAYDVFIRYLIKEDLPYIIDLNKYKKNKKEEESSIADKVKKFFPDLSPGWQPA